LVPLSAMLEAGRYFLSKQDRSRGVSEQDLIHIAVKSLGLDELAPFDPNKKIIEYALKNLADEHLVNMTCKEFTDETASESMAPGGGSISALAGGMGAALSTMVANLSANKVGWETRVKEFSLHAEQAQKIKDELMFLVDEDTRSFNAIIEAMRMPKGTIEEKTARKDQIAAASVYAAEVPLRVMNVALRTFESLRYMVENGNPNSITDAGVGSLCTMAAIEGAWMNVMVNAKDLSDKEKAKELKSMANDTLSIATSNHSEIVNLVKKALLF
jgi:glutamate formiminotransferase / formiminotetrahydrofolate cyclodeaminase